MNGLRWNRRWIGAVCVLAALLLTLGTACSEDASSSGFVEAPLLKPPLVPPPTLSNRQHVVVHLQAIETEMEVAPGVTMTAMTFNGSIPGPMIRVRVGDTVEVHLKNSTSSAMTHNIDLHAVNGPHGGGQATVVAPGEERAFTFKALTAGLFVYHCASGIVADHIANGMYGAILVDPATGKPHVDHEYYVGQSDLYTAGEPGAQGHQDLDVDKLLAETPTYVVFNGNTKSLTGDGALQAKTGEKVRIYFVDGGPNMVSSFHVIGEIFDRLWQYGSLESEPLTGVQTTLVPAGGAAIVEFEVDVPGDYKLVDHSISRVSKGAAGVLHVEGPDNPEIFSPIANGATLAGGHAESPTATATATSVTTATAAGAEVSIAMTDNAFDQPALTAKSGETITFSLSNEGKVIHNMRIAAPGGGFDGSGSAATLPELISPGKTGTLTWTAGPPGTYQFRCDVHPDQMTGTINVQ